MSPYQRPDVVSPVCRDAAGNVIDYGHQWGPDGPPESAYSVDSHPERFAPLATIAEALITYLRAEFDTEVHEVDDLTADPSLPEVEAHRLVRLIPADPRCASLQLVFTDYPGIVVHAGLLHRFLYPPCGCDACDESLESMAEALESDVLAVVGGGYRETVGRGDAPWVGFEITHDAGGCSSSGPSDLPQERVAAAKVVLESLDGPWAPWPART